MWYLHAGKLKQKGALKRHTERVFNGKDRMSLYSFIIKYLCRPTTWVTLVAGVTILLHPAALKGQDTIVADVRDTVAMVRGKVVERHTGTPMFHAHIINLSRNRATLSDRDGHFRLPAAAGDTVYFSHVGYKKRLVPVPARSIDSGDLFRVALYVDTVVLRHFRVLAASRQVQFRHDFINRQVAPDTLNPAFEAFLQENHFSAPTGSIVLPGPVTLIYENFNRSARQQRRIARNRERYFEHLPEEEKRKVLFYDEE